MSRAQVYHTNYQFDRDPQRPTVPTVNAITTERARKLSAKDKRVIAKLADEIRTLEEWGCFTDEQPLEDDVVLNLIVIPTEVDGEVKVRIGIRGDMDKREVRTDTELPSVEVRTLSMIRLLNERRDGRDIVTLDVPKAYYQTE